MGIEQRPRSNHDGEFIQRFLKSPFARLFAIASLILAADSMQSTVRAAAADQSEEAVESGVQGAFEGAVGIVVLLAATKAASRKEN